MRALLPYLRRCLWNLTREFAVRYCVASTRIQTADDSGVKAIPSELNRIQFLRQRGTFAVHSAVTMILAVQNQARPNVIAKRNNNRVTKAAFVMSRSLKVRINTTSAGVECDE